MVSKPNGPIRRSQLIAPFGPGAMVTVPGGASLIVGGLDYWFPAYWEHSDNFAHSYDVEEFTFNEWRLERLLSVGHFRLPPDYRKPQIGASDAKNIRLTIPAFRFPMWHFCPDCSRLQKISSSRRSIIECLDCKEAGKKRYMYQVPFVAVCRNGHLQDFPWSEWVHRSVSPSCSGKLRLRSTGSATLAGQKVYCDGCGQERNLGGITIDGYITENLDPNQDYYCESHRPWIDEERGDGCGLEMKGSLRSAANIYYSKIVSSIYLPRSDNKRIDSLLLKLQKDPEASTQLSMLIQAGFEIENILIALKMSSVFREYSDDELEAAVNEVKGIHDADTLDKERAVFSDERLQFRFDEYQVLRQPQDSEELLIKKRQNTHSSSQVDHYFDKIMLLEKLRETRVLAGFTRVVPENGQNLFQSARLLWKNMPEEPQKRWLPAYKVYGEGIYLEINPERLMDWEMRRDIQERINTLATRFATLAQDKGLQPRKITPRFVLLHSLAHILINRLTFECGYSSASLRERLYVSDDSKNPMSSILIYTAAGDAEGTMGGLVRLGKTGNLEPILLRALEDAQWCSADPVCMEVGQSGQGPESTNLAACHNCLLVPETACEEFNRFLDRGVLVGSINNPGMGFFAETLSTWE